MNESFLSASAKTLIHACALQEGFDVAGFAAADLPAEIGAGLDAYLDAGRHGDMMWMEATRARRRHPRALWPEAVSSIALGISYAPAKDPLPLLQRREKGYISVYARNRDYHDPIKKRLKRVARYIAETFAASVKVFVDTAPLMEKPLAAQAGLGWQGKHTNLVSRTCGSWLLLGHILTTLPLVPDPPHKPACGSCRRCLALCPTGALDQPHRIDARRCISYLSIEHRGPIPHDLRPLVGNRIYGCDDCLAACPWNRFTIPARHDVLPPHPILDAPNLADFLELDERGFRLLFSSSPIKRIGRDRFMRNVLIALGNSAMPSFAPSAARLRNDPSPLAAGAAVWAWGRLSPPAAVIDEAGHALRTDLSQSMRLEWETARLDALAHDRLEAATTRKQPPAAPKRRRNAEPFIDDKKRIT